MTVLTAHKILISSAVGLCIVYATLELRKYLSDEPAALLRGGLWAATAVGLALYLRWVWIRHSSDTPRR